MVGPVQDFSPTAKRISDLRQLGVASSLFENEYGHLPWWIFPPHAGDGRWPAHLMSYVEGQVEQNDPGVWSGVYECLSKVILPTQSGVEHTMTYSANRGIFVVGTEVEARLDARPVLAEEITSPSEVILLGDGTQRDGGGLQQHVQLILEKRKPPRGKQSFGDRFRHRSGSFRQLAEISPRLGKRTLFLSMAMLPSTKESCWDVTCSGSFDWPGSGSAWDLRPSGELRSAGFRCHWQGCGSNR